MEKVKEIPEEEYSDVTLKFLYYFGMNTIIYTNMNFEDENLGFNAKEDQEVYCF